MDDLQDAIVILGVAHTRLFNGDEGIELIMLDLASGQDFTLPVTEEQADQILQVKDVGVRNGKTEGLRQAPATSAPATHKVRDAGEVEQL